MAYLPSLSLNGSSRRSETIPGINHAVPAVRIGQHKSVGRASMLTDLCMLDELAMRLRVAGRYALELGTATRLGRIRSVIRSLPLHALSSRSFRVSSSLVIDDVG